MADHENTQIPEIIVCGSNNEVRANITASIENLDKDFLLMNIDKQNSEIEKFASAAVSAELLVIALDRHDGFVTYYRKLIKIASVLGVQNIFLVLMNFEGSGDNRSKFRNISHEFDDYISSLTQSGCGPVTGSTLIFSDTHTDWYEGRTFARAIIDFNPDYQNQSRAFRLPVGSITPTGDPTGTIAAGSIQVGVHVVILPSAVRTSVSSLEISGKEITNRKVVNTQPRAQYGQSVTLRFETDVSVNQGDMICSASDPVEVADQFETTTIWLSKDPMMAGRHYDFKSTTNSGDATVTTLKYLVNVDSDEHVAAKFLQSGEIGVCNISLSKRIPFEHLDVARETSQFTLINKETNEVVGMGAIHFALRRASNVHWQALDVTRNSRAELKGQRPAILWFTGLSGSGKSAIANIVEKKLVNQGRHTYTLDGDNIRHGLNRDLGFTDVDRVENIRRIGEVSKLMADCGLICLVSFISPFRSERKIARELAEEGEFIEIHVDTPLEVAEARDVKGLYKKARAGEIKNFTGIDSPYEPPENPEIRVDTVANSAEEAAEIILEKLQSWGKITPVQG